MRFVQAFGLKHRGHLGRVACLQCLVGTSGKKCQKWLKTVKNDRTSHVFTYKCPKLYFEPFQALLLVTYPIIHPQDLKSKHFPFQGLLQQKSFYFRSYDKIDHPQHNTTSLLMLRNTLLHPISHESELLLLFLLEVSAFSLPFPFVHRHSPPHII